MKNLLVVNSCINRETSRTGILLRSLLDKITFSDEHTVSELILENENLSPLNASSLKRREQALLARDEKNVLKYAFEFAAADTIVISAPYWDLSFPSMLKVYFEHVTVNGIVFKYNENGIPVGLCKCKKLYYVTTCGGFLGDNLGFEYVRSLCSMYGINEVCCVYAEGLDILGADVDDIMRVAAENIKL